MGGRIAESQSKAAQQHCFPLEVFLAGSYRSKLADTMFTCATCHYIALSCLVCQSQYYKTTFEKFPLYPGLTKALCISDSEQVPDPGTSFSDVRKSKLHTKTANICGNDDMMSLWRSRFLIVCEYAVNGIHFAHGPDKTLWGMYADS